MMIVIPHQLSLELRLLQPSLLPGQAGHDRGSQADVAGDLLARARADLSLPDQHLHAEVQATQVPR